MRLLAIVDHEGDGVGGVRAYRAGGGMVGEDEHAIGFAGLSAGFAISARVDARAFVEQTGLPLLGQ